VSKTRIVLVDDHALVREGLRALLEDQPDMEVVAETGRGRDAGPLVAKAGAAVAIVDISMPDAPGRSVCERIRAAAPDAPIVVLTRHAERAYVRQMTAAGASAYVLKHSRVETLIEAIRAVAKGGTFLDPSLGPGPDDRPHARGDRSSLTVREREVATMVALGHTNKEIAATLDVTVKTVETHKDNLMKKLGLRTRAELVRFAMTEGWIGTPAS
jgi:DNA-binding NarL/FixJ family response regulator